MAEQFDPMAESDSPYSDLPFADQEQITENRLMDEIISNAMTERFGWMERMMKPRRDIDGECGYPTVADLDAGDYRDVYDTDALAARIVEVLPKESWQVQPKVYEDEDPENETEFETAYSQLPKYLGGTYSWYNDIDGSILWDYFLRLDIASGIGHYGILLLGINDGRPLWQPLKEFEGLDSYAPLGTDAMYGTQPEVGDSTGYDPTTTKMIAGQGPLAYASPVPHDVKLPTGGGDAEQRTEEMPGRPGDGNKLIYLKVFDETLAQITRYEKDPTNPRFGQPQIYRLTFNDPRHNQSSAAGLPVATSHVHWSRVIHYTDTSRCNDVLGYPRMQQLFKRIIDALKTYAAAGEGFWQQCFSMLSIETNPNLGGDVQIDHKGIRGQLANLRNRLQRHLVLAGATAKTLPPTVNDPTPFINVFIEVICIFLGCPVRVFKGSERGELASSQDDSSWNDRLRHRQMFVLTPKLMVPFINRLIQCKVLPEPKDGFHITWPDLEALSDKDKAAIAQQLTAAMSAYVSGQCENIMTPFYFLTEVCKIDREMAEEIIEAAQQAQDSEEQMTIQTPEEMAEQQQAMMPPEEQGGESETETEPAENSELFPTAEMTLFDDPQAYYERHHPVNGKELN